MRARIGCTGCRPVPMPRILRPNRTPARGRPRTSGPWVQGRDRPAARLVSARGVRAEDGRPPRRRRSRRSARSPGAGRTARGLPGPGTQLVLSSVAPGRERTCSARKPDCACPVALPLVGGRDHEPPQEVERLRRILVQHEEAHGDAVGVDGPVPRLRLEQRLREGDCVRGHGTGAGRG